MLYQLHIFLLINGLPFLIDSYISNNEQELLTDATERKVNNSDYRCVLVTYKADTANMI